MILTQVFSTFGHRTTSGPRRGPADSAELTARATSRQTSEAGTGGETACWWNTAAHQTAEGSLSAVGAS